MSFDLAILNVEAPIVWSRVEEVAPYVMRLAKKHDLACFDPQDGQLHLPA